MKPRFFIVIAIVGLAYMAYGYLDQKNKDNQFSKACMENLKVDTPLTFALKNNTQIPELQLQIIRGGKVVDRVIVKKTMNDDYLYEDGCSVHDTLSIMINKKIYSIYGFQYHAVTINDKKGLECKFKGAFLNQKWNEGYVFELN